ncbi:hypothetical protein EQV77_13150 [Halobacillus fulvus]|nr:hypothetical protein EQV77_13150 [Halobacillus fulvus]
MNKKEGLIISLLLLSFIGFFVWYSSGTTSYSGQSKNWAGQYTGVEDGQTKVREFIITYTGVGADRELPVTYRIDSGDLQLKGTKRLSDGRISIRTECSDCRIARKETEIPVILEWEGQEEELVLSK